VDDSASNHQAQQKRRMPPYISSPFTDPGKIFCPSRVKQFVRSVSA